MSEDFGAVVLFVLKRSFIPASVSDIDVLVLHERFAEVAELLGKEEERDKITGGAPGFFEERTRMLDSSIALMDDLQEWMDAGKIKRNVVNDNGQTCEELLAKLRHHLGGAARHHRTAQS